MMLLQVPRLERIHLETLRLSENKISEIDDCTFCSCQKLTHLDLSHNFLTAIDHAFGDIHYEKLRFLDLSHNMIQVEVKQVSPPDFHEKNFCFRKLRK